MNINATIFGQMITFAIFVWVNMKFIWPKLNTALIKRERKISQGLQAAEQGQHKLQMAETFAKNKEAETKKYCAQLINEAKKQAEHILELAVIQAKNKGDEIIKEAHINIEKEQIKLQKALKDHLADLIIYGAEKIITDHLNLNKEQHKHILLNITNNMYDTNTK